MLSIIQVSAGWANTAIDVAVSIEPQRYFVENIGGSHVKVTVMVPPGANPASYEPKPQQMMALTRSKIYFSIGVPFECVWLPRFRSTNPAMVVVAMDAGIAKRHMKAYRHSVGQQDTTRTPGDEGFADPHIWLSPPLVMLQARHIVATLCRLDPKNRPDYEINYRRFIMSVVKLDAQLRDLFDDVKQNSGFMVYHPAWGYFAQAYGLQQWPVELEGKQPKAAELRTLIEEAHRRRVKAIFVQPQFSVRSAQLIAEAIHAKVIALDPLAYDWVQNLLEVGKKIRSSLTQ